MRRSLGWVLIFGLLLAGCESSRFVAQVTQFHELPPAGQGRSFMVAPADQAKGDSLEFAAYARRIVAELQAHGYRQAARLEESELLALVDYSVDSGTVETYSTPIYGYYPGEFRRVHGVTSEGERFSAHVYDRGGFVPLGYRERAWTLYQRRLNLDIVDAAAWRRGRTIKLYEGRVSSTGPESDIAAVMSPMIRALFVEFPGVTGATRTIILAPEP